MLGPRPDYGFELEFEECVEFVEFKKFVEFEEFLYRFLNVPILADLFARNGPRPDYGFELEQCHSTSIQTLGYDSHDGLFREQTIPTYLVSVIPGKCAPRCGGKFSRAFEIDPDFKLFAKNYPCTFPASENWI
ncbi:hypothetical protein Ddc_10354 [Ditylenchus destructor]|nr:hypothetical protein Ddc_10354 [Ditylenchus destructor]